MRICKKATKPSTIKNFISQAVLYEHIHDAYFGFFP